MPFPIRSISDNDTTWGADLRSMIQDVNSTWLPTDQGFTAWTNDPQLSTSSTQPTAGTQYLIKVKVPVAFTCTIVSVYVSTSGATVGNSYLSLYNTSGTQLGVSSALTTAFQSSGLVDGTLASGVALTPGYVHAGILIGTSTTVPAISRTMTATTGAGAGNANLTAATARAATAGTGLATSPASITMSGISPLGQFYWIGLR